MHAKLLGATLTALAVVTLAGTPLQAQRRDPWGTRDAWGNAYDLGYRDGAQAGRDDARDGRGYEYQRHRDYRDANGGYDSRDGSRDAYRDRYRSGFVAGYRDGYYSASGRGAYGRTPEWGYGTPDARRDRGSYGGYGRAALQIAQSNGYEDGYRKGLDDGRDRDRFDPHRYREYRNGNRGYRGEYGPKSAYQQAFRSGFERGYGEGYRDGQRSSGRRW